jgi:RNA polymerase sigma-70 factor (sigma-E family)
VDDDQRSPALPGFAEFATARQQRMLRTAYLLCGNHHTAEDLVQTAFYQLGRSWARASRADSLDAYARQTLVRCYLDQLRKRHPVPMERAGADQSVEPYPSEVRIVVLQALAGLPVKARAVLVLRFWEDLSVAETAAALGISTGTVKSQTSKALDKLRTLLDLETFIGGSVPPTREETAHV